MGKASRDKGARREREIVELLNAINGVHAERVPLSGAAGGSYAGDIQIITAGEQLIAEVKARKNGQGFVTLEKWLGDNDMLILKRDRQKPMVVLPWEMLHFLMES